MCFLSADEDRRSWCYVVSLRVNGRPAKTAVSCCVVCQRKGSFDERTTGLFSGECGCNIREEDGVESLSCACLPANFWPEARGALISHYFTGSYTVRSVISIVAFCVGSLVGVLLCARRAAKRSMGVSSSFCSKDQRRGSSREPSIYLQHGHATVTVGGVDFVAARFFFLLGREGEARLLGAAVW